MTSIKICLLAMSLALISAVSYASPLNYSKNGPTEEDVARVREYADEVFLSMDGVNGVGTTACEENSGTPFMEISPPTRKSKLFVLCIGVTTKTKAAYEAMMVLFPRGQQIDGIYVTTKYVGPIGTE